MRTLRALWRARLMRGVLDGSRLWMVIGGLAAARRLLRFIQGREDEVVYREELAPGQSIVVSHSPDVSVKVPRRLRGQVEVRGEPS